MLVSSFDTFVRKSDKSADKAHDTRVNIAIYGLVSEVGSVVAAIKKRLLATNGMAAWDVPNDEIIEELGDVVWYCFSLSGIANPDKPVNIFTHNIVGLKSQISADSPQGARIREMLGPDRCAKFLEEAKGFPRKTKMMTFEDYQTLASLTARTEGLALLQVCLAILWQHSAELMRHTLPAVELKINKAIADRKINDILGDIAWHVSALASLYKLRLSDIAEENQRKASQRWDEGAATPLHDEKFLREQFPRRFEIEIVTVANGRVRMYYNGRRLGDELTDNADQDDGYRFHDIMHLANVAFLGWSPVLRGLMKLKRKSDPKVDENQDGARATIVEEAIVKAIHSHGEHLYKLAGNEIGDRPRRLFSDRSFITFQFLKFIQNLARGLEVQDNKLWEWEKAIIYGHEIYYLLQCEGQGTVTVDLHQRSISFSPEVCPTFAGKVVGLGSATSDAEPISRQATVDTTTLAELSVDKGAARQNAQKNAILNALGFQSLTPELVNALDVVEMGGGRISMKTRGLVQQAMWSRRAIGARTTLTVSASGSWHCTAVLLGDG